MNKIFITIIFSVYLLLNVSCASVKSLDNEKIQDVFSCAALPDKSLHDYAKQDCKNYLINITAYDIDKFYEEGGFALILTSAEDHELEFSFKLIDKFMLFGADINFLNYSQASQGANALMIASLLSQVEIVDYLLSKGADVCIKNGKGKTAIDYLIPKNKNVINAEKQAKINKIKPMLLAEMKKKLL